MYFFLDVERRRVNNEIAPVLLVLAAPDELRIKICVSRIADFLWILLLLFQYRLIFRCRNIFARGLVVLEAFDGFRDVGFFGQDYFLDGSASRTASAISAST